MRLDNHNTLGHHFRDVTYLTVAHSHAISLTFTTTLSQPCAPLCTPMHLPQPTPHALTRMSRTHLCILPDSYGTLCIQLCGLPNLHGNFHTIPCTILICMVPLAHLCILLHTTLNEEECNALCGSRRVWGVCKRF